MMITLTRFAIAAFLSLSASVLHAAEAPYTRPGMKHDVEFAKVGDVSLTLDAFIPEGSGPFPTCILVHGGGFTKGDKQTFIRPLFEPLSNASFAWFTVNYRLAPQHRWPACAEDVATAIRWVKAHAAEYKVDVNRIALIGESAGGHLVSWAGVNADPSTSVAAVVPFYAPNNFVAHVKFRNGELRTLADLSGETTVNETVLTKLAQMSPSTHIKSGLPPFLLIHGDADTTVAPAQSTAFQKSMKAAGNICDLIIIPGGMGAWEKLGSDYQAQTIQWLHGKLK